jgi:hypothetical protein
VGRFCAECGSPLPLAHPSCGLANEPSAKFCVACGANLVPRQTTGGRIKASFQAAFVHIRPWLGWAFVGVVVITLAVMYVMASRAETFTIQGRRVATLTDDTYISMRYARHLANGHGLVWNIGEAPVEGFTNFLWVAWIALRVAAGLNTLEITGRNPLTRIGTDDRMLGIGVSKIEVAPDTGTFVCVGLS